MWISIKAIPDKQDIIYLPRPLANKLDTHVKISFGQKSAFARVEAEDELKTSARNDYRNPVILGLSNSLINELCILKPLTYQMKYRSSSIIIGPVIGMLLGNQSHRYNPRHMIKYSDRRGAYDKVGGLIYAFSPKSIDWENLLVYGLYYNNAKAVWQYGCFPIPSAIYRRDFHSDEEDINRLIDITDDRVFNSWRFSKFFLYEYIAKSEELSQYLPPTELMLDFEQVKRFIDSYNNVILKPINLSRGRGICIIKKEEDLFRIYDYRGKELEEVVIDNEISLNEFFNSNKVLFNDYIIQKCLSLAKIDDCLFDIRVVMQKEMSVKWKCTGIECRVAANGNLVTNISRGGYALTIDEALKGAFTVCDEGYDILKEQLDDLCYKLCMYLDEMDHHFAEFGIDIAIDEDKKFWIIEVNVFPSFKGFAKMDYQTYLSIRHTPVLYASYLAGF